MISFKYGVILGAILLICIYFVYKGTQYNIVREGFGPGIPVFPGSGSDDANCLNLGPGWSWGPSTDKYKITNTGQGDGWVKGLCPSTSCWNEHGSPSNPKSTCNLRRNVVPDDTTEKKLNTYSCSNLPGSGWLSGGAASLASQNNYTGEGDGWGVVTLDHKTTTFPSGERVDDMWGSGIRCPPSSCFNPNGMPEEPNSKCMLPRKPPPPSPPPPPATPTPPPPPPASTGETMPIGSGPYIQPCPPGKKEYWGIGNITRGKNKYVGQPIKKGPITEEECRAGCSADSNCSMWLKYPQTGNCWYIPKTITIPDIRCEDEGGQAAPAGARPLMYGQMKCQWASGIGNIKHFNFKKSADGRKFTDLHLSPPTEPCPTGNVYCEANSSVPGSSAWSSQCPSDTQHMIDNPSSIQCGSNWDDSECLSKCCVPNKTCSTYEKCKQLGYELDPDKTSTPCNNNICDDPQCCSKDTCVIASIAGIFTCEQQHHLDPAKQDYVCGDDCDSETCCKLNDTCGVGPPPCPQNQYYSKDNSAVVCANAECLSSDCCLDNPTCSSYKDCNTAKQHVGNPSQSCDGGTCDKSCCVDNKKCGGFKKCNPKRHVDPNKRYMACNNNVCTDKQCCSDNPKCSDETDYSCPSSQYVSSAKKTQTCIGEKCTAGECCIPEPTCSTYQCYHPDTEHMPDNTIPCPNGICDDKTCCIPNIKCSTFKNCNPGRHIKKEDISCYNNICSDEQCCITNAKCGQFDESGFTCEDNEYIKLPNHTCKEEKCTPQECCVADPTCGSYTCSVGHLQHIKDPSILCPDGNCTDELCCVDNDKCNSFTCPVGKHGIAEDERCTDNICTEDQCCVNNQRCATSWCDENYTLTNISTICKHKECTAKECCEPNPTCSSFSCEAGYTMRSSPAEIICEHLLCTGGDCCLKNQKCSTYNCRAGQTKKEDNKVCEDIKCTNEECCTNNPTCSTYNCESSYYTTRTLVPHAEDIICGELKCKESECCDSKPTNKLPKINVWPLYDNS